jgi:hypothetical protein
LDGTCGHRDAVRRGFGTNVHHVRLALRIKVSQRRRVVG